MPRDWDAVARHGKAPFFSNDCLLGATYDFWIDHCKAMPSLIGVVNVNDNKAQRLSDLHGGETCTPLSIHDVEHLRCETIYIRIDYLYRLRRPRQQRVVNRKNWFVGHG